MFTLHDVGVSETDRDNRREEEMRDKRTKPALGGVVVLALASVGISAAGVLAGSVPGSTE